MCYDIPYQPMCYMSLSDLLTFITYKPLCGNGLYLQNFITFYFEYIIF